MEEIKKLLKDASKKQASSEAISEEEICQIADFLEIPPNKLTEMEKKAYKALVKKWHTDTAIQRGIEPEIANNAFIIINSFWKKSPNYEGKKD